MRELVGVPVAFLIAVLVMWYIDHQSLVKILHKCSVQIEAGNDEVGSVNITIDDLKHTNDYRSLRYGVDNMSFLVRSENPCLSY